MSDGDSSGSENEFPIEQEEPLSGRGVGGSSGGVAAAAGFEIPVREENSQSELEAAERDILGAPVSILFQVKDGDNIPGEFKMGHTVAFLKVFLDNEANLPYDKTEIYFPGESAPMPDPLTLSDLPFSSEDINVVEVRVN